MRCIRCDPNRREDMTPGEAAVASPGNMDHVLLCEEFPAPCGSIPASDDGVPFPDDESPAPCDDVSSSRRLSAFSRSLSWICADGSPADVASKTPDEPAVDSTPGGDAPFSCDASSCVSLM